MAASAVRLTRSGAVGCSRWETSQGRGGPAGSIAQPLASHHSLCATHGAAGSGAVKAAAAATSAPQALPSGGGAHDRHHHPHKLQLPLGLPPLSSCAPQQLPGAAAIPPAVVAYRGKWWWWWYCGL
jgi:hypothetical protein